MDDENRKEENQGASTSKKENKDRKDDDEYDERDRDDRSYTETTVSEYSARSRVDMRKDGRPDQPRLPLGKRDGKLPERKKRVRRGRVVKRRRSTGRRYQPLRRAAKRRPRAEKRDRDASVSTIFTRLSSRSGSDTRSCTYCGHRCCGRRCSCEERRTMRRIYVRKITKELRKMRMMESRGRKKNPLKSATTKGKAGSHKRQNPSHHMYRISEGIQTGSHSKMLSPLFLNTNAELNDDNDMATTYVEITPDMIYEALRKLTMWRQAVPHEAILENMKMNYPVNPNNDELSAELAEKLKIATIAGLIAEVTKDGVKQWCLTSELQDRGLTKNHVTMFWKVYGDTLTPITKRVVPQLDQNILSESRDPGPKGSGIFGPNTII